MLFYERLRELRTKNGLTQKQAAEKPGVSEHQYQHLESGDFYPQYETFLKLADYFEVSLDYLAGRDKYIK